MIRKVVDLYLQKLWVQTLIPVVAMVTWVFWSLVWVPNFNMFQLAIVLPALLLQVVSTLALFALAIRCLVKAQWWAAILRLLSGLVLVFVGGIVYMGMGLVAVSSRVSP